MFEIKGVFVKIGTNELRAGMLVEYKERLWNVTKTQHVKPGKGGAFVQAEMKDIKSGTKINERFRSEETIERAKLDEAECQLLFKDGDSFTFMDLQTYEQFEINKDLIGESASFLSDNMIVNVSSYDGEVIGVILPETVVVEVIEADAVVKKQTASSSYKPAIVTGDIKIMVPPHIDAGMKIVVNTSDCSYVERAKE